MDKIHIKSIFKNVKRAVSRHCPEILTAIGITGMITATVLAVKATPKAIDLIEHKKKELHSERLTKQGIVKTAWKCYIPTAIVMTASAASIVIANSMHEKRSAALTAAYMISESARKEYHDKAFALFGEKRDEAIQNEIAKDHVTKNPLSSQEVIVTEKGDVLCLDALSGRYFRSDLEQLKRAENVLNRKIIDETFVSLNEFYSEIGLKEIPLGDKLGWDVNDGGLIDFHYSSQIAENGNPCIVLGFYTPPHYDFH